MHILLIHKYLYLYNMEQLDLFGIPPAPEPKPEKKKPAPPVVKEPVAVKEVVVVPVKKEAQRRGRKSLKEMVADADLVEIPADELLFEKQYYAISEVAAMFHVNVSLLRFWENEFDILKPKKNKKGDRFFRPEDVKNLELIHHLLRRQKYTIEGAKDYLKKNKSKAIQNFQMIQSLQKIRAFLLELKAEL
jgi:DNA-binding transcriptional MerR regulator